jgi:hypothetical protein
MNLQPDPAEPGLWINPDWQPNTPGTYVMLIGSSAYPHLAGGTGKPAVNNYSLGQLTVSALTVNSFFNWIRDSYSYVPPGDIATPVANCWRLLSPTNDELKADPSLADNPLSPTFNNCTDAIRKWHDTMKQLRDDVARKSRLFFLFSGHGLEITQDNQILLPCDYLKPVVGDLNDAINISRLSRALAGLKLNEQFFFLDACRNDHESLRVLDLQGNGIVVMGQSFATNAACNGPILYASASGMQTYSPATVDGKMSLFGQALLNGLQAQEGFDLGCAAPPCPVKFAPLHEYVSRRVNDLLVAYHAGFEQYVLQSGRCARPFAALTYLQSIPGPPAVQPTATPSPPPPMPQGPMSHGDEPSAAPDSEEVGPTPVDELSSAPPLRTVAESTAAIVPEVFALGNWRPLVDVHPVWSAHDVFGHETVTEMWTTPRIFSMQSRQWLADPTPFTVHRVERSPDRRSYRVTASIPNTNPIDTHWVQFKLAESSVACLLPGSLSPDYGGSSPKYTFDFSLAPGPGGVQITRIAASLSTETDHVLGMAANLWEKYQNVSAIKAVEEMDLTSAVGLIFEKMESPLAAVVGFLILYRAGRLDKIQDQWLKNTMNWFPYLPDGPVLLNEYVVSTQTGGPLQSGVGLRLKMLEQRGLPFTAETLGYAVRQLDVFRDVTTGQFKDEHAKTVGDVAARLQRACRYFRTGGLFTSFAGKPADIGPELVLGNP